MSRYVGVLTSAPGRESAPEGRKGSSLMVGEGKVGSGGGSKTERVEEQQPEVPNKVQFTRSRDRLYEFTRY